MSKLLHEKKMNIVYGITKIDVDMTFCAKNVGHGNSKDHKEVNDYIKALKQDIKGNSCEKLEIECMNVKERKIKSRKKQGKMKQMLL